MKFIPIILICSLLLLLVACKSKECVNVQVGTIDLAASSLKYVPYQSDAIVTFKNEIGASKSFSTEVVNENYEICVKYICEPLDPYKSKSCEYYQGQGIRNILRATNEKDLLVELVVSVQNYEEESTLFYDFFNLNMSAVGNLANGESIPHVHFTDPNFEKEKSILRNPLIEKESITLLGQTFIDVLHTEEAQDMVYFQQGVGIIALKLENVIWLKE